MKTLKQTFQKINYKSKYKYINQTISILNYQNQTFQIIQDGLRDSFMVCIILPITRHIPIIGLFFSFFEIKVLRRVVRSQLVVFLARVFFKFTQPTIKALKTGFSKLDVDRDDLKYCMHQTGPTVFISIGPKPIFGVWV